MKTYKVAIIELAISCTHDYDGHYEEVSWDNAKIDQWTEVTEQEYKNLKEYFEILTGPNSHKYETTRRATLIGRRFKLVRLVEPDIINLSIKEHKKLAAELVKEKQDKEIKKIANDKKREAKALAGKKKKLAQLKKELGE